MLSFQTNLSEHLVSRVQMINETFLSILMWVHAFYNYEKMEIRAWQCVILNNSVSLKLLQGLKSFSCQLTFEKTAMYTIRNIQHYKFAIICTMFLLFSSSQLANNDCDIVISTWEKRRRPVINHNVILYFCRCFSLTFIVGSCQVWRTKAHGILVLSTFGLIYCRMVKRLGTSQYQVETEQFI